MNADPFKDVRERRASAGKTVLAYPGRPLADIDRLLTENERLREACPFCGHLWKQHDPEGGQCDSHASEGIGVCPCGRKPPWMQGRIAALSRAALAAPSTEPDARPKFIPREIRDDDMFGGFS
jgi:hypothetical protein